MLLQIDHNAKIDCSAEDAFNNKLLCSSHAIYFPHRPIQLI